MFAMYPARQATPHQRRCQAAALQGALRSQCGAALIGLVLTLLIILALVFFSRSIVIPTATAPQTPIAGTQQAVCQSNIATMRNAVTQLQLNSPGAAITTYTLKRQRSLLACPEGGSYRILDGQIYCTRHFPPTAQTVRPAS